MSLIPDEGVQIIAESKQYKIYTYPVGDKPCYFISGLSSGIVHGFFRDEWDELAKIIAYADLKIRAVVE